VVSAGIVVDWGTAASEWQPTSAANATTPMSRGAVTFATCMFAFRFNFAADDVGGRITPSMLTFSVVRVPVLSKTTYILITANMIIWS
jgi:hypothetical protein